MRIRFLLCWMSLLGLLAACSSGSGSKKHRTGQVQRKEIQATDTTLVGKRLYLEFASNSSVVEYLSPRYLFWSSQDSVHGYKEGEDNYHAVRIGTHVFFVNWVEDDGTTVSQVLDLKERTCQAFLTSHLYSDKESDRGTITLKGTISKIEDSNHLLLD